MPAKKKITKERILHTALSMLEKNGYDTVNVKSLAAKLDCSTQPIYLSYRNMAELRQALCEAAVQKFTDAIGQDGCLYGMEYIRFAKENRNLFRFLFMRRNAFSEMKRALSSVIERSVQELMRTYHLSHQEAEWKHDQLWMHSHGIASMLVTDFCDWDMEKAENMVEEAQRLVLQR